MSFLVAAIIVIMAASASQSDDKYLALREKMVREQIVSRGVSDQLTLKAIRKVPRHLFVPT